MIKKLFFVIAVAIISCREQNFRTRDKVTDLNQDSLSDASKLPDTTVSKDVKTFSDAPKNEQVVDSDMNCDKLLFSLVNKSRFSPDVKKFKYKVWVDELSGGVAILKVTMRNTERNEDIAIGWLKMDINKQKLLDITFDPDNPAELNYDTVLFRKVINSCRLE